MKNILKLFLKSSFGIELGFIVAILAATYYIIAPGLNGSFYYDDVITLSPMGKNGGIQTYQDWLNFAFSSEAGPLKRPLSMATFPIDDQNWPTSAYSFKHTNLIIHLANGILIFLLTKLLCLNSPAINCSQTAKQFIPLLTMAIWLIHPVQLSTIFPVVQRMNLLSTFFSLLGLIFYLKQRHLLETPNIKNIVFFTFILMSFGILAALSKENGILLPLYILAMEATLLAQPERGVNYRYYLTWKVCIIYIPVLIIFSYLLYHLWLPDSTHRDYTNWQHLITQPKIIFDYLSLLIPQIHVSGYFRDNYPFYQTLMEGEAILYLSYLVGLLITAFLVLKKYPFLSFAIFFYLAGHSLESSTIPLELFYEHRNYLPVYGFALLLALLLYHIPYLSLRIFTTSVFSIILGLTTHFNSTIWGDSLLLYNSASEEAPYSTRAPYMAALEWEKSGQPEESLKIFTAMQNRYPNNATYALHIVRTKCLLNQNSHMELSNLFSDFSRFSEYRNYARVINDIRNLILQQKCSSLTLTDLIDLLQHAEIQLLQNEHSRHTDKNIELENIYIVLANIYLAQGKLNEGIQNFKHSLNIRFSLDVALNLTKIYIDTHQTSKALGLIEKIHNMHNENDIYITDRQLKYLHNLRISLQTSSRNSGSL